VKTLFIEPGSPLEQLVSKQYKRSSRWCHSPYGEQWLDKQSFHTNTTQPFTDALGRELSRESLRMCSGTPLWTNRSIEPLEHILAGEPLGDIDRQALPSKLVHEESLFE